MALKNFIVKIISDLDETGFKKLEELQADADTSVKKLSISIKDLFSIQTPGVLGRIADDAGILNKSLITFPELDIYDELPEKEKNPLQKNFNNSDMLEGKPNNTSSGIQKFLNSVFNSVFGGVFLNNVSQKSLFGIYNNNYNTAQKFLSPRIYNKSSNAGAQNLSMSLNNISSIAPISEKTPDISEFWSQGTFLPAFGNESLQDIFSMENVSDMSASMFPEISSTESGQEYNSSSNSVTSETITNSGYSSLNLTIAQGAIQVNTTGENPQAVGDAVRTALTDALDDFIMKRGYTKAV